MRPLRLILFLLALVTANAINAQVTVSGTVGGPITYGTLSSAFTAINNGTHRGSISITITANSSLGSSTAALVASGVGSANYTSINISPSGGNFTISGSANGPMILLNGADNVTINGINSGTNSLTFTNSNTSQGHVIQLTNGATNNIVTQCTLLSSNTVDFWGVITFMGNTGNSNNAITYNTIGSSSSGNPTYGIIARGETPATGTPTSQYSTNVIVRFNNIYNYSSSSTHSFGIYILDGHSDWTIQGNKFYQTASLSLGTTGTRFHGAIWIYSVSHGGFTISNNLIGYANSSGTGTYSVNTNADVYFWGITLWLSSTATSTVDGNIIRAINFSTNATGASLSANSSFGVFSAIWARAGNINIGNTSGNIIGGNSANISVTFTNSTSASPGSLVNGIVGVNGTIKNNTISDFLVSHSTINSTYALTFYGINGGTSEISNNVIGNSNRTMFLGAASGTNVATYTFIGINSTPPITGIAINNNTIQNIENRGHGSAAIIRGISVSNAFNTSIVGNTVSQLTGSGYASSTSITPFVCGIYMTSINGNHVVNNNTVKNLSNKQSASGSYVNVFGMHLRAGSLASLPVSNCNFNHIYNLSCISSNPTYAASTYLYFNAGKWNIVNNNIAHITNNTKDVYGIEFNDGNKNVFYNSIYINGGNSSNGISSCIKRTSGIDVVLNNLLFNARTFGSNYSLISSPSSINLNCNYNLYIASDTSSLFRWGGNNRSWYNYYTTSNPNDKYSWCAPAGTLASMFMHPDTGDLRINPANANSWYINGKGIPIADIDFDWEQLNGDRSASLSDGATDIGADEVVPTVAPPAATHTGTFAAGQSSVYVFGGRTIAQIDWQTGSTLPTAQPTVLYYSGNNPPYPIPGKNAANCYWKIDATATADLNYKLKLWMSPAVMGAVPSTLDLRMAKNSSNAPSGWSCACSSTNMDANAYSFNNSTSYTSFSFFTATDNNNPLPVELLSFTATPYQDKAQLTWATASEQNSAYFDIERSTDGNIFSKKGTLAAAGNSISTQEYAFEDATPITTPITYYRLKMVDADGSFSYSEIRKVERTLTNGAIAVYPSPTSGTFYITIPEGQEIPAHLELTDITGKVWLMQEITLNAHIPVKLEFPSKASSGLYFLSVLCNGKTSLVKLSLSH
jgi:hypothetical protein